MRRPHSCTSVSGDARRGGGAANLKHVGLHVASAPPLCFGLPAFQRLDVGAAVWCPGRAKSATANCNREGVSGRRGRRRGSEEEHLSNRALELFRRPPKPVELALMVPKPLN